MIIRSAYYEEINLVADMAVRFFKESAMGGLTYDRKRYIEFLEHNWNSKYTECIVAVEGDKMVGYASGFATDGYTKELVGELFQFYVTPEFRGTMVARKLAKAMTDRFKMWGCSTAHVQSYSGINVGKFRNLWSKLGYKEVGLTMGIDL